MKIHIITTGSPKLAYAQAGFEEYRSRLMHYHTVRVSHIADKRADTEHIMQAIGTAYTVALEIEATQLSSQELASFIETRNQAGREVAFLIGGPDGLPLEIRANADRQLSFSRLTFPHDLAMVILVEALYRASMIATGQPYHR